jgi:putative RecB family exonuclease
MTKETLVAHRSFSALTSWIRCGKSYELERVHQAPSEPAWWFVGGSAFHTAAEKFLLAEFENKNDKSTTVEVPF